MKDKNKRIIWKKEGGVSREIFVRIVEKLALVGNWFGIIEKWRNRDYREKSDVWYEIRARDCLQISI